MTTPEQLLHDLTNYPSYMNKGENWPEANIRIWESKLKLIQQVKSEWCRKQRENCSKSYLKTRSENMMKIIKDREVNPISLSNSILNAPEP